MCRVIERTVCFVAAIAPTLLCPAFVAFGAGEEFIAQKEEPRTTYTRRWNWSHPRDPYYSTTRHGDSGEPRLDESRDPDQDRPYIYMGSATAVFNNLPAGKYSVWVFYRKSTNRTHFVPWEITSDGDGNNHMTGHVDQYEDLGCCGEWYKLPKTWENPLNVRSSLTLVWSRDSGDYPEYDARSVAYGGVKIVRVADAVSCEPSPEQCNGKDDNCDGQTDNEATCPQEGDICVQGECVSGCPNEGEPCLTGLLGICSQGTIRCENRVERCLPVSNATEEICGNGIDEDCNGTDLSCMDGGVPFERDGGAETQMDGASVETDAEGKICVYDSECVEGFICEDGECRSPSTGVDGGCSCRSFSTTQSGKISIAHIVPFMFFVFALRRRKKLAVIIVFFLLVGCASNNQKECAFDSECPDGKVCEHGLCIVPQSADAGEKQDASMLEPDVEDAGAAPGQDAGGNPEQDAGQGADAGADRDGDRELVYTCTPIGSGYSDGFFSMEAFGGKLYAGQFGYGHESESMLYSFPPWELVQPGLTGISESICAMEEFDGYLYANTESSGDIFRSADGSHWERVYNGENGSIGCGMAVFQDKLYAINYQNAAEIHGRILRQDGDSWTTVYDSGSQSLYIREIVAYNGMLYAFAVLDRQGQMLSSPDGSNWNLQPVANRYFRGHVWNGYLWLGSTDRHADGEVGVWRFDGSEFLRVHQSSKRWVTDIKDVDGRLFASTSNGWKDGSGPSSLLMSPDGQTAWETICTFSETAVWNMAVFDGQLYLGTWDYGNGGKVYRVSLESVAPDTVEPADCSLISQTNSAWEVCETGPRFCAGVFTDGAGCEAYCAAAGLVCTARYGGEPGCQKEPQNVWGCFDNNGHNSDWCECGVRDDPDPGDCTPRQGSLGVGQPYLLDVDAHTGDEATTQPKADANDGRSGDNPAFRRHNVARAHNDYWYTSNHQEPGEPDPNGEQWVDYVPDFGSVGVGCYQIIAQYRGTDNRATYPAQYRVLNSGDGDVLYERVQQSLDGQYIDEDLGNHYMCPDSRVRIQDPGPSSISFNKMRFIYLGHNCP